MTAKCCCSHKAGGKCIHGGSEGTVRQHPARAGCEGWGGWGYFPLWMLAWNRVMFALASIRMIYSIYFSNAAYRRVETSLASKATT